VDHKRRGICEGAGAPAPLGRAAVILAVAAFAIKKYFIRR
jgi:hypothetical protein